MTLKIRPYRAEDRGCVRAICFETGMMGDPIDAVYGDRESFADLFTAYYTDYEPEHCFVVDADGRVVGYLLGTLDSRRVPSSESIVLHHVLKRFLPLRHNMARFFWRGLRDVAIDRTRGASHAALDLARFPAHTHFNLLPEARMAPIAAGLYRAFFTVAKKQGCPGIHGQVFVENARAMALHEAMGFARAGAPYPAPGMRMPTGERLHIQLWTRKL